MRQQLGAAKWKRERAREKGERKLCSPRKSICGCWGTTNCARDRDKTKARLSHNWENRSHFGVAHRSRSNAANGNIEDKMSFSADKAYEESYLQSWEQRALNDMRATLKWPLIIDIEEFDKDFSPRLKRTTYKWAYLFMAFDYWKCLEEGMIDHTR